MLTHQRRSRAGPRSTRPLIHLECSMPSQRRDENSRTEPKVVFNDRWSYIDHYPVGRHMFSIHPALRC
ncbi:hypothetical protein DK412_03505 [Methylobacterium sp. 17Sr1-1]|nr:hypothetical protein DK412_03505 [Methylobacterium sp. 17Sr1-1]